MKPKPTVAAILEGRYGCREREGGCGAERGEKCKTWDKGKPTAPHADRWRQWEIAGHPGAWWHQVNDERQPPVGSREDLLDGISKSLALIERNISELRRLNDAK